MSNELVQYFLVNKDIKMGKGKIAAQVAHAATIYAVGVLIGFPGRIPDDDDVYAERLLDFYDWYYSIQKKIILKAPQSLLEYLESRGYLAIRDKGYTQVPENALTVVTLGVTTREAVSEIVEDLPLL